MTTKAYEPITINGFVLDFFQHSQGYSVKINRPGPITFTAHTIYDRNLPLLIMEAIEWTYDYNVARNESNQKIIRGIGRKLPDFR